MNGIEDAHHMQHFTQNLSPVLQQMSGHLICEYKPKYSLTFFLTLRQIAGSFQSQLF